MDWKKKEYWLVFCLLALTAAYSYAIRYQRVTATEGIAFNKIPLTVGDWTGSDFFFEKNVLDVLKADETLFRRYVNSRGEEVWLFIGYWRNQKYGAQPHSPLHCLPGSGWNIVSNDEVGLDGSQNGDIRADLDRANYAKIANDTHKQSMLFWYQTRGGNLSNELMVKLDLAKNAILRKPTDVAFLRVTMPVLSANQQTPLEVLSQFWSEINPYVIASLPFDS